MPVTRGEVEDGRLRAELAWLKATADFIASPRLDPQPRDTLGAVTGVDVLADVHRLARSLGCPARRVPTYPELLQILDEVVPTLADRTEPLLLGVPVIAEPHFEP